MIFHICQSRYSLNFCHDAEEENQFQEKNHYCQQYRQGINPKGIQKSPGIRPGSQNQCQFNVPGNGRGKLQHGYAVENRG